MAARSTGISAVAADSSSGESSLARPQPAGLVEIGDSAVWSLSTAKPGFGAAQLRDNDLDSYWQSDGTQPHLINIQLPKKQLVSQLQIYLDHSKDESYTPSRLIIRVGSCHQDLVDYKDETLTAPPEGWVGISLLDAEQNPIHTNFVQIAIVAMHQNGRDTHVRQVLIFGPLMSLSTLLSLPTFRSPRMNRHLLIR